MKAAYARILRKREQEKREQEEEEEEEKRRQDEIQQSRSVSLRDLEEQARRDNPFPELSVYFDMKLNPYGAPPPGRSQIYKQPPPGHPAVQWIAQGCMLISSALFPVRIVDVSACFLHLLLLFPFFDIVELFFVMRLVHAVVVFPSHIRISSEVAKLPFGITIPYHPPSLTGTEGGDGRSEYPSSHDGRYGPERSDLFAKDVENENGDPGLYQNDDDDDDDNDDDDNGDFPPLPDEVTGLYDDTFCLLENLHSRALSCVFVDAIVVSMLSSYFVQYPFFSSFVSFVS